MRELLPPRAGLSSLQWGTRFIYTVFLLFCTVGYVVMTALAVARSGLSTDQIATYYVGDESRMVYGKTYGELLEVTHFHLFSMPLLLFVQGHLFLLTAWPLRAKVALVLAATLGIALDLAAPWLIVYVSPDLALLKTLARVLMAVGFAAFALVPLYEMWLVEPPAWDDDPFAEPGGGDLAQTPAGSPGEAEDEDVPAGVGP